MGRTSNSEIDTPSKRVRLAPRKNPYWVGLSGRGGVSLGYRKPKRGHGGWVAKVVIEGNRIEETLGPADDDGAPYGELTYRKAVVEALEWGSQQHAAIEGREASAPLTGPTVTTAVNEYVNERLVRSKRDGTISKGRLENYVLSDEAFAKTPLSKLRAATIQLWRERLTAEPTDKDDDRKRLAPSSVNRLLNDLRAALNASAEKHRRQLPAALPAEIKVGTRATRVATEARKQLLSNEQIKAVVDAAFAVDVDGDFGRLTLLAASTGARYSQLARIRVGGLQIQNKRIMVPGASKGRSATARPPVAVPLSDAVIERLLPAVEGRAADEPLLMRWAYRNVGPFKWEKDNRRPWGPAYEIEKSWAATIERAEVPADTIMYALRHSSIVRGLKAGLPIRLVASLHDTSSEMIEKHYSAFIVDMTEDLARRAALVF